MTPIMYVFTFELGMTSVENEFLCFGTSLSQDPSVQKIWYRPVDIPKKLLIGL